MKKHLAGISVIFTTAYLAIYMIMLYSGLMNVAMFMLAGAPLMIGFMVFCVIRYGKPSGRTFSEYFYDDVDWRRR